MSVHGIRSAPTYAPSDLARKALTAQNWLDLEDAIIPNWKSVAEKLNMEKRVIKWCKSQKNPPKEMLDTWRTGAGATVGRLYQGLRDAGATEALKVFRVASITQTPVTAATTVAPLVHAAASSALPVAPPTAALPVPVSLPTAALPVTAIPVAPPTAALPVPTAPVSLPTAALTGHASSANVLTPEDLFNAECELVGDGRCAWRRVGANLGFTESRLDYFAAQSSPPRAMIKSWLGTLNALITACDDAGNDAAASVFRAALARAPMETAPGQ